MRRDFRKRVLAQIAQTSPAAPSVSGSPTNVTITEFSPNIVQVFGEAAFAHINQLIQYLNPVVFYSTNGSHNLATILRSPATADTSGESDLNTKKIMEFAKQLSTNIFQVRDPKIARQHIENLERSSSLNSLSNTNPQGQLVNKLTIQGNIKTVILNLLTTIKQSIPAAVAQRAR